MEQSIIMLFSLIFRLWQRKLQDLWTYGFIKINRIDVDSMENRGRYLSKYFGKDLELKEHKKGIFQISKP